MKFVLELWPDGEVQSAKALLEYAVESIATNAGLVWDILADDDTVLFENVSREPYQHDAVIFTHVNEEGMKYDESTNADAALKVLEEFPNDFVIVTVGRKGVKHLIKQLNR